MSWLLYVIYENVLLVLVRIFRFPARSLLVFFFFSVAEKMGTTTNLRSWLYLILLFIVVVGVNAQNRRPKNVQVAVKAKWQGTPLLLEAG